MAIRFSSNAKKVLKKIQDRLDKAQKDARQEIGKMAVAHFKKSFDREGFNNVPFMHWKLLKRPRKGGKILNKTGKLKNSLRYRTRVNKNSYAVSVFSVSPYAEVHNLGLRSGRGGGFKMPKRQFMGYSKMLEKKLSTRIANRLKAALR